MPRNDPEPRLAVRWAILTAAVCLTAAQPVWAQSAPTWSLPVVLERLDMAQKLAAQGQKDRDPVALLAAARLVVVQDVSASPARTLRGPSTTAGATAISPAVPAIADADRWLDEAQRLASHRPELLALIQEQRPVTTKGAARGPRIGGQVLGPLEELQLEVGEIVQGAPALFEVASPQIDSLSLQVMDPANALVCSLPDAQRPKKCLWTPVLPGKIRAVIRNRADHIVAVRWGHN